MLLDVLGCCCCLAKHEALALLVLESPYFVVFGGEEVVCGGVVQDEGLFGITVDPVCSFLSLGGHGLLFR